MKKLAILAAIAAAPAFADQPVSIKFEAEMGGQPFACSETYSGLGNTDAQVRGTDYRMYLTNVAMLKSDGTSVPVTLDQNIWQHENIALLDFEDATGGCKNGTAQTNMTIAGTVPEGSYEGVTFDVGVPFEMNHKDPTLAPSPLNLTALFWNWRGGYRFLRIDMVPNDRAEDGPKGWFLHLGSTMCKSDSKTASPAAPCANPNYMSVSLNGFDPATDSVVIDPAPVVAEVDLRANAPDTSPGCMSFPKDADCRSVFPKLGLDYGRESAGEQLLFVAR